MSVKHSGPEDFNHEYVERKMSNFEHLSVDFFEFIIIFLYMVIALYIYSLDCSCDSLELGC